MPVAWHCIKPNSAPLPASCWTWGLGRPPLSLIVPWASPLGRQGFWEQKKLIWGSKKEGLLYCFCISKPGGFIFPLTAAPRHHPLCLCSEVWFGYWASTGVRSLAGTVVPWGARSSFLLSSALGSRVPCLGAGTPLSGHQRPVVSAGKKTMIRWVTPLLWLTLCSQAWCGK